MNYALIARTVLRLGALAAVSAGIATEGTAAVFYQNADIVAVTALLLSEAWLAFDKWRDRKSAK